MEAALIALMLADAPLAALVGDRIDISLFPQGTVSPAIRISRIGGAGGYTMQGPDGLDGAQVQIDIRATPAKGQRDVTGFRIATDVAKAIKAKLSGYRGVQDATRFAGIFLTAERAYAEKQDSQLFHIISLDFDIWSRAAS